MSRFVCHPTPIEGLLVIEHKPIQDERGFFARFFCEEEFAGLGYNGGSRRSTTRSRTVVA